MKKFAIISFAALTALSLPASIMAQDAGMDLQAGVDITADQAISAGQATTMLTEFSVTTVDVTAFADASAITIVNIGVWMGDDSDAAASAALTAAIEASSTNLMSLQSSLSGNATIVAALEAEGYTSKDVVGLGTSAEGDLTIFVQTV